MRVTPSRLGVLSWIAILGLAAPAVAQENTLHILIDQSPRAVEYQLGRLTNEELVRVDRRADDPKYRPVFAAILTRKGVARQYRDEALSVLTRIDRLSAARVLLAALLRVPDDDPATAEALARMLVSVPAEELRADRPALLQALDGPAAGSRDAAFAALVTVDPDASQVWQTAESRDIMPAFLRALRLVPRDRMIAVGSDLFSRVMALIGTGPAPALRAEAWAALGWTARDRAAFDALASQVLQGTDERSRAAALGSLQLMPPEVWAPQAIEPLTRAVIAAIAARPSNERTQPAVVDTIQFGQKLAAALPSDRGRPLARELGALGVRVVRIEAVPENLAFNLKWFVVQAARPVQLVFANTDNMPHNVVIGRPGSVEAIGNAGSAMPMPIDPNAKAFVPDLPQVLFSTNLVQPGETGRLSFTAPKEPGEYIYVCTFPGHWVRMYGVMLVVPDLDAWEGNRTLPSDPITKEQLR